MAANDFDTALRTTLFERLGEIDKDHKDASGEKEEHPFDTHFEHFKTAMNEQVKKLIRRIKQLHDVELNCTRNDKRAHHVLKASRRPSNEIGQLTRHSNERKEKESRVQSRQQSRIGSRLQSRIGSRRASYSNPNVPKDGSSHANVPKAHNSNPNNESSASIVGVLKHQSKSVNHSRRQSKDHNHDSYHQRSRRQSVSQEHLSSTGANKTLSRRHSRSEDVGYRQNKGRYHHEMTAIVSTASSSASRPYGYNSGDFEMDEEFASVFMRNASEEQVGASSPISRQTSATRNVDGFHFGQKSSKNSRRGHDRGSGGSGSADAKDRERLKHMLDESRQRDSNDSNVSGPEAPVPSQRHLDSKLKKLEIQQQMRSSDWRSAVSSAAPSKATSVMPSVAPSVIPSQAPSQRASRTPSVMPGVDVDFSKDWGTGFRENFGPANLGTLNLSTCQEDTSPSAAGDGDTPESRLKKKDSIDPEADLNRLLDSVGGTDHAGVAVTVEVPKNLSVMDFEVSRCSSEIALPENQRGSLQSQISVQGTTRIQERGSAVSVGSVVQFSDPSDSPVAAKPPEPPRHEQHAPPLLPQQMLERVDFEGSMISPMVSDEGRKQGKRSQLMFNDMSPLSAVGDGESGPEDELNSPVHANSSYGLGLELSDREMSQDRIELETKKTSSSNLRFADDKDIQFYEKRRQSAYNPHARSSSSSSSSSSGLSDSLSIGSSSRSDDSEEHGMRREVGGSTPPLPRNLLELNSNSGDDDEKGAVKFVVVNAWNMNRRKLAATMGALTGGQRFSVSLSCLSDPDDDDQKAGDKKSKTVEFDDEEKTSCWSRACRIERWVQHPNTQPRTVWEVLSMVLVMWDCIWIPFRLLDPPSSPTTDAVEMLELGFWSFDIIASLMTGFVTKDGSVEMRPRQIAKRYFRTWFMLDLFVVGIHWFETISTSLTGAGIGRIGRATRAFRILRMARLLRLVRMRNIMSGFSEYIRSESMKQAFDAVKYAFAVVMISHVVACLWYGLDDIDTPNTWVKTNFRASATLWERYCISLHWSLTMFAGGMDEFAPTNVYERLYAIIVFITCFMLGAVLISSLTSSMTQLQIMRNEKSKNMAQLRQYLADNFISSNLSVRVQRNVQHSLMQAQHLIPEANVELLTMVSEPLRIELHFEMYARVLERHPFFDLFIEACPHIMQRVCHVATTTVLVSHGDIIFNVGEIPPKPKFCMVCTGTLNYIVVAPQRKKIPLSSTSFGGGRRAAMALGPSHGASSNEANDGNMESGSQITPGHWVAEPALWTHWMHRGMLTAAGDCRLCLLDALKFQASVSAFEMEEFNPKVYAAEYVEGLNRAETLSDLMNNELEQQALARLLGHLDDHTLRVRENPFGNKSHGNPTGFAGLKSRRASVSVHNNSNKGAPGKVALEELRKQLTTTLSATADWTPSITKSEAAAGHT